MFLDVVKKHMLQKLENDRQKFIFVYIYELGHHQNEAAEVIGVHETNISREMDRIRELLESFRPVKKNP